VCFLAGTLGQGGAEQQLVYILKSLKQCGAVPSLLCLTKGEHWEAPIRQLGVPIHFVGGSGSRLVRLLRVLETVRRLRPQLLQSQHFYTNLYSAVPGRCLRIASVGAVRSNGLSELQVNGRLLGRLSLIWPDRIAANSQKAITNLVSLGFKPEKFLLLPNVVDTAVFTPAESPRSTTEFLILGVGSLEPVKRFDRLLQIAAELRARLNRVIRVVLAGEGSQRHVLETLAEQTRREGVNVELLGRVANPLNLYQSADVLLVASDREGTPNVILEAMACGVPVVATNVGGIADLVIDGENGFLFEPNDTARAVGALERLAREAEFGPEIGRNARGFIERHHSTNLLPEILEKLYETVLAPRWES
jgi:glycosyltransferase involved in cell wall biosynthesis